VSGGLEAMSAARPRGWRLRRPLRAFCYSTAPPVPAPSSSRLGKLASTVAAAALGGALALRFGWGQLPPPAANPGRDASTVAVLLAERPARLKPPVTLTALRLLGQPPPAPSNETESDVVAVDAGRFADFVAGQRQQLAAARRQQLAASASTLDAELRVALAPCLGRVDSFANWYFAYATNYKMLGSALRSAAQHCLPGRSESSVAEVVALELQVSAVHTA
jgi:hypothetical protein